jgi:predicted TPR repeat methyltransferase
VSNARLDIRRAIELHKAGRLSEAEAMYLGILRRNATDADALHFLGLLRLHQGRRPAATELMQRSLKLVPTNPHAWNNLGNLYMADGQEDQAEEAYMQATRLAPTLADAWYNLGILFRRKRNADAALLSFRRVLDSNPRFSRAYESLGLLLYRMGRSDLAADVYRKWLEVEPGNPVARHMSAATSGEHVPERAANRYVEKVFNEFASSFDESLKSLDYAAPQLLSAALAERIAFGDASLDVLDAGCGTGLCGVLLRSTARTLTGVDLSSGMLARARERKVYDELVEAELCQFMGSRPAAFDVVNCADTLVYFGALEDAARAARDSLRPNGIFAFTVEAQRAAEPKPYGIGKHGRYTHSRAYLEKVMDSAGFGRIECEEVVLRKELGVDVIGYLIMGHAPA